MKHAAVNGMAERGNLSGVVGLANVALADEITTSRRR
jgi:hypothetical protein